MERNREIDLYRMLFGIIIVFVHSYVFIPENATWYPFCGGYLAVEFFFILSGYFAAKKAEHFGNAQVAARQAFCWTWKKLSRIYPYVIPAVIMHYLGSAWLQKFSLMETCKHMIYSVFEMLLLGTYGIYKTLLLPPLWYLSALFLVLPLFYYVVIRLKDTFFWLLSPLFILLIYGYFSMNYGRLDVWSEWTGKMFLSVPRAWGGVCGGGLCYCLSEKLKRVRFSKKGLVVIQGVKIFCFTGAIFYMLIHRYGIGDFACVGAIFIALTVAFSQKERNLAWKIKNVSAFADFSLALYVSHETVRNIICAIMPGTTYWQALGLYLLFSFLYAGALMWIAQRIQRFDLVARIKRQLLLEEQ